MSSSGLLERYIGPDRTQDPDKEEKNNSERLPRIWPGFVISGIYLLWSLVLLLTGGSDWADPCPIVGLPIACYWYFCIYKIHKNLRALADTYPISPLKATTLTITPSLLAIILGGIFELTKNPFLTLAVTVGLFCNMLFNVYWQMRWTSTAVKFAKEKGSFSKIPNWIPGIILIIGASLGNWVSTPLGALVTFGVGLFLVKKIGAVISVKDILSPALVTNTIPGTPTSICTAVEREERFEIKKVSTMHAEHSIKSEIIPDLPSEFVIQGQNKLLQVVARNAFRILGLPMSASQSEVLSSVSALRRAIKIGKVKETVWDIPCLGILSRTNGEIQNAENQLIDPETRSIERLFWFHNISEGGVNSLDIHHADSICNRWSESDSLWAKHDIALLRFITAAVLDPNLKNEYLWSMVATSWKSFTENDAYWASLLHLDKEGQFERSMDSSEVLKVRSSTLKVLFNPIAIVAKDALIDNDLATAQRALKILTGDQLPLEVRSSFEQEIAMPLEQDLEMLCEMFEKDCNTRLKRDEDNTDEDTENNKVICNELRDRYQVQIEARLDKIIVIFGEQSDVSRRGRESSARCLKSLALAYTWADDKREAVRLLEKALLVGKDTIAEFHIAEKLSSIKDRLEIEKNIEESYTDKGVYDVTLQGSKYSAPNLCACCLNTPDPASEMVVSYEWESANYVVVRQRKSVSFKFPYCKACISHTQEFSKKCSLLTLVSIICTIAFGLIFKTFQQNAIYAFNIAACITIAFLLSKIIKVKALHSHGARTSAVMISSANDREVRFTFWNKRYAELFSDFNECQLSIRNTFQNSRSPSLFRSTIAWSVGLSLFISCFLMTSNSSKSIGSQEEQTTCRELNNAAVKELNSGNIPLAIKKLEQVLKVDPNYKLARDNLSIAHGNYGLQLQSNPEAAIKEFHQAIFLNPDDTTAQSNLAVIISRMGKKPNSFTDRVRLGKKANSVGDIAGAIVEYSEALKIKDDPDLRLILNNLREQNSCASKSLIDEASAEQANDLPSTSGAEQKRRMLINLLQQKSDALQALIEKRASELKSEKESLLSLKTQIAPYKALLKSYEDQIAIGTEVDQVAYGEALNKHNSLVKQINTKFRRYENNYGVYSKLVEQDNEAVKRYNALIKQQ